MTMSSARYGVLMFLSGAAGLMYQIIWVRQLSLTFGATTYAVATTVAAFMAGLALGSAWFGKRADAHPRPLLLYCLLEGGIALTALTVTVTMRLLDDTLTGLVDVDSVASSGWTVARFALVFLALVVPTSLMGGTLPTLARGLRPELAVVGRAVGWLYAANTYGGVVGALLVGLVLIPSWGTNVALGIAVSLNVLCAALVWVEMRRGAEVAPLSASVPKKKKRQKKEVNGKKADPHAPTSDPLVASLVMLMLAGFCTLAFETLWVRAFVVSFKSTVYLFSNLLVVFLLGMAMGSHLYARRIDRLRSPLLVFGVAQILIGVWGMLSVFVMYLAPDMALWLASQMGEMSFHREGLISLGLMTLCFFPAAALMGIAYPLICKVVTHSEEREGASFGNTYAVSSLGAILGALVAGFLILPGVGLQKGLFLVSALSLGIGYMAMFKSKVTGKPFWLIPVSAFVALCFMGTSAIGGVDIGLGAVSEGEVVFKQEGVTGTVRVTRTRKNGPLTLMVNNYQLATSGDVAVRFGHLPLLLKPDAKEVALISLGSGITAGGIAAHDVTRIDCVELVPALKEVQPLFSSFNRNVIDDPRFHLTFWDGRHFIAASRRTYDIIVSDLFQPDSAGIGSLYTLEHFSAARDRLSPDGMMAQWLPLYQLSPESLKIIMATFAAAFPHVSVWFGDVNSEHPTLMLAGSLEPLLIRPDRLFETLNEPKVRQDMIEKDDPLSLLSFFVFARSGLERYVEDAPLNTDAHPLIEYLAPRTIWNRRSDAVENFASLASARQPVIPFVLGAIDDAEMLSALRRYFSARGSLLEGKIAFARSDFPGALKHYRKGASLAPHDPFLALAVFDMGYLYYHRRDYGTAAKMLDWAARINPDLVEARFYLAKAYQLSGDIASSQEVVKALVRSHPEIARAMFQGS